MAPVSTDIDPASGLTGHESDVMDRIIEAWDAFLRLEPGAEDVREFRDAMHRMQAMLALRIVRRNFSSVWSEGDGQ